MLLSSILYVLGTEMKLLGTDSVDMYRNLLRSLNEKHQSSIDMFVFGVKDITH